MSLYRLVIYLHRFPSRSKRLEQALFIGLRYKGEFILKISPRNSLKGKKRRNWKIKNPFKFIDIGLRNITNIVNFYEDNQYNKLTDDDIFLKLGSNTILYDLQYTSPVKFQKAIFRLWTSIIYSRISGSPRLNDLLKQFSELDLLIKKDM